MAGWLDNGQMRWTSDRTSVGARLWTSPAVRRAWGLNGTRRLAGERASAPEENAGAATAKVKGGRAEQEKRESERGNP